MKGIIYLIVTTITIIFYTLSYIRYNQSGHNKKHQIKFPSEPNRLTQLVEHYEHLFLSM